MTSGSYVSDAEIEAAAAVLAVPFGSDGKEAHRLVSAALTAAARARESSLVRADGTVFRIGTAFSTGRALWRCTDVRTRTITAVRLDRVVTPRSAGESETWAAELTAADPRKLPSWLSGPPCQLAEFSFDEQDIEALQIVPREKVPVWDPVP